MQTVETTVTPIAFRMRLADHADREKATTWIEFELPYSKMTRGSGTPVASLDKLPILKAQVVALENARAALGAEIDRLERL